MPVRMVALRRYYHAPHRKEYKAGEIFSVDSQDEADRLARRSKAEIAGAVLRQNPTDMPPVVAGADDDLSAARREYEDAVGKRPYHGWDAAELRSRMNTYRTTNMGDSNRTTHLTSEE